MSTREIKTRFSLEGEQGFKKAMSDAASSIKVLNSEQKLAKAQFEATGDAQQYAADQARILKEQIEHQKRAVKAAEDAVAELTRNGVEPNSKQMQTWKTRLNNAQTALYNMQGRLNKVGGELGEETTALEKADDSGQAFQGTMQEVANGVNLQNVITAIDNVTEHIETVVKAAARAAKAVWEMGVDAGKWADDIATAASELGVDPETYQSWQYASRFIDTSVQDIEKSWTDVQKNMKEGNTDYLAMLAQMGIASMKTSGEVRESSEIFWDAVDYLHGIDDASKLASEATRLFGNDWRKLNPLITAGSQAYKDMAEEGRRVAVVSNSNVEALGAVDDAVQDFTAQFDKLKYDALAELAPTFESVAKAMSTAVGALNEFVQSEEGQAAFAALNESLSGLIASFLGEDGKGTFEGIVEGAKDAVKRLTDALDWISQNGDTVTKAVEAMAIAWGGLKISKEVLLFVTLLKQIPLAKLTTIFGGGAAEATAAGAAAGTAGKAAAAGALGEAAVVAGSSAAVVGVALAPAVVADKLNRARITEQLEEVRTAATEAAEAIGEEADAALAVVNAATDALGVSESKLDVLGTGVLGDVEAVDEALKAAQAVNAAAGDAPFLSGRTSLLLDRYLTSGMAPGAADDLLYQTMQEAVESIADPKTREAAADIGEAISDAMDDILAAQEELEESVTPETIESMYGLVDKLVENRDVFDSLSQGTRDLLGAYFDTESGYGVGSATQYDDAQEILQAIYGDLEDAWDKYIQGGRNLPEGYAQVVAEAKDEAITAAGDMAQGAIDSAAATLDSHSPSRVFEALGENVSVGMANGIYARGADAINAARWLAQSVTNIVQAALQIHSPSKTFERLGELTGAGFALGIEHSADRVSRAVDAMIGTTTRRPAVVAADTILEDGSAARPAGSAAAAGARPDTVHVTLMLDEDVLGDVMAPIVNDRIGAKINATRR